ncbi:n1-acetylpolyamine oxidase [Fusarium albosuccineum]|uniref:N1-acetylpolyamine oxidase n=1 Tax=Fusarium albosuccineum TaxID=1237068 RepID=A0A8H4LMA4_9HYPO|nr:n1-acetylpolyamine oxidase [Fusarium albosuccineum]
MKQSLAPSLAVLAALFTTSQSAALPRADQASYRKTKVAILRAGIAGIAAAQNLTSANITDFLIIKNNDYIGGRLRKHALGKNSTGQPYTVEFGAN